MAQQKNIARIADHPMFGKQGQKGTSPSWPGRKIISLISPATPPSVTPSLPPDPSAFLEVEPPPEAVVHFLEEELRRGKI